jgi:hypothetical protein
MREITGKEIEKRAIMEIIDYFEPMIINVIRQSEIELQKLNEIKKMQGINSKVRIDKECVINAIKNINMDNHSKSVSFDTGGMIKKEKKDFEVI